MRTDRSKCRGRNTHLNRSTNHPTDDLALQVFPVCGIAIAAAAPAEATEIVIRAAEQSQSLQVHLCNAYTLSLVDRDAKLRAALEAADLNLPDGTPVAWLGRHHGVRRPVRGPGLVKDVAKAGVDRDVRHYLYGGADGVAVEMATNLRREVSGVQVVGAEAPPFRLPRGAELDDLAERVRSSGANVLWVGLGTPRQDYVVPRLANRLSVPIVPVGAAFDFWAGRVAEAPTYLHGSGLEWAYRLIREPRRLWRRYLIGSPRFLVAAARHRMWDEQSPGTRRVGH